MSDDDDSSDSSDEGGCGCVVIIILFVMYQLRTLVWQFLVSGWGKISSGALTIDSYLDTHHKSQSSEAWIDSILEGELRALVADIGTSSLIDQPGFVRQDGFDQPSPEQVSKRLREALTNPLTLAVSVRMKKMGLLLEHLEIQELGFEESIQKAIDTVWTAQAKPYVGRIEGIAEAEKLKALVEQVGVENAIALVAAQQPNGAMNLALTGLIAGAQQFLHRDQKTLRGPDTGDPKARA